MDLPFVLNSLLSTPLHDQLADAIADYIRSGKLSPGQALPSTRALASSLGVSRDTVVRSYDDLVGLGFLRVSSRSRTFVSDNPPTRGIATARKDKAEPVCLTVLSAFAQQLLNIPPTSASAADLPEINYGAAPASMLPVKTWNRLMSRHCGREAPERLVYVGETFGSLALRDQICRYLNHSRGMHCESQQVVVFSNDQLPLQLIARSLINSGDLVAVEDPCHTGAKEIFLSYGARLAYVPIDEHGLVVTGLSKLEQRCKLIYVSPAHQDPTGVTMPLTRREALLAWARKHCDFVVEDGFDSDYFYKPPRLPALAGMDSADQVIHIYSFWKLLFPLVTTSSLVLPQRLIAAFSRVKASVDRNFSLLEHSVLADFLQEGHLEKLVHKNCGLYQQRRQALAFAMRQCFRTGVKFFGDGGGLHLTVRFDLPLETEDILACAKSVGLPMASSAGYYATAPVEGEVLLAFAGIEERQAQPLVERFADAISEKIRATDRKR